jgi:hypothetical protein
MTDYTVVFVAHLNGAHLSGMLTLECSSNASFADVENIARDIIDGMLEEGELYDIQGINLSE